MSAALDSSGGRTSARRRGCLGFNLWEGDHMALQMFRFQSAEGRSPGGADDAAPLSGRTIARRQRRLGYSRREDDHMAL